MLWILRASSAHKSSYKKFEVSINALALSVRGILAGLVKFKIFLVGEQMD